MGFFIFSTENYKKNSLLNVLKTNQKPIIFQQKMDKKLHFFDKIFAVFRLAEPALSNIKNCNLIFTSLI